MPEYMLYFLESFKAPSTVVDITFFVFCYSSTPPAPVPLSRLIRAGNLTRASIRYPHCRSLRAANSMAKVGMTTSPSVTLTPISPLLHNAQLTLGPFLRCDGAPEQTPWLRAEQPEQLLHK